ncbi:hypothetical protein G4V03_03210 [Escherichia coli]|nr:hypothetical protein [Escherichia coli]
MRFFTFSIKYISIWRGHRLAAQMEGDRENYYNYIYRPNSVEPLVMLCHHSFEYDYYQEHRSTDRTLPVKQNLKSTGTKTIISAHRTA